MAFIWTSAGVGSITTAQQINEVKTNTDVLADNLSIAHYSWVEMPISVGDKRDASQISELQDALDYIDTNNVCSSENSTQYSTDNPTNDDTVDGTEYTVVDNNQHNTYNATQDVGVDGAQYGTVDSNQHGTYDSDQNTGYNGTEYGVVRTSRNLSV